MHRTLERLPIPFSTEGIWKFLRVFAPVIHLGFPVKVVPILFTIQFGIFTMNYLPFLSLTYPLHILAPSASLCFRAGFVCRCFG
jgi:F0F1-type ATP synthase membrane subunit a